MDGMVNSIWNQQMEIKKECNGWMEWSTQSGDS